MGRAGALFVLLAFVFPLSAAADTASPEQQRRQYCRARAEDAGLIVNPRKHFIARCIAGDERHARHLTPHQLRNEACNTRARESHLEGQERRGYLSQCARRSSAALPERDKEKTCTERAKGIRSPYDRDFVNGCLRAFADAG